MSETWDNPLYSMQERLQICAGAVEYWKECYENQYNQKIVLEDKLEEAFEHIQLAFHPEIGWAIKQEDYAKIVDHNSNLTTRVFKLEEANKQLEADLYYARQKIKRLEHAAYLQSWEDNPDRMGS